jgi:F-box and leucine-rich repeat protein GRR1
VSRLRGFLNQQGENEARGFNGNGEGTMYNDGEEADGMQNVTAQANGMMIDELEEEEGEFGGDSEMLGQD